jgi:hypothetical protein
VEKEIIVEKVVIKEIIIETPVEIFIQNQTNYQQPLLKEVIV